MNINNDMICEEKVSTQGRISFGNSSIEKKVEQVSTGERKDGNIHISCWGVLSVYSSKQDKKGKRTLLYSGPKSRYLGT